MSRPRILQELCRLLQARFEEYLRLELPDGRPMPSPGISVHLAHPLSLERANTLPVAALYLWEAAPDPALKSRKGTIESIDPGAQQTPFRAIIRGTPQWIRCRFALAVRGRGPEEELDLYSAALQGISDSPSIALEAFASLKDEAALKGVADLFPIKYETVPDLWRQLGLPRHVLMLSFEVLIPLPSRRKEPAVRVFERQVVLDSTGSDLSSSKSSKLKKEKAPSKGGLLKGLKSEASPHSPAEEAP